MAYPVIEEARAGRSSIGVVSNDTNVFVVLAHNRTNGIPRTVADTMESTSMMGGSSSVINVNDLVQQHQRVMPNMLVVRAPDDRI